MFAPWKESCDKPRWYIKKQRHHFAKKGPYSQNYGFPVAMYRHETWTIKMAKHWRTDAFELWYRRRLLRVPWTARRSNQSIIKEINPEYSLEGLMLKLKLQCFGHLMQRTDSLERDPDAGKDWRQEEKGTTEDEMVGWHHWLDRHEFEQTPGNSEGQGSLVCCSPGVTKSRRQLSNWTTTNPCWIKNCTLSNNESAWPHKCCCVLVLHFPWFSV